MCGRIGATATVVLSPNTRLKISFLSSAGRDSNGQLAPDGVTSGLGCSSVRCCVDVPVVFVTARFFLVILVFFGAVSDLADLARFFTAIGGAISVSV